MNHDDLGQRMAEYLHGSVSSLPDGVVVRLAGVRAVALERLSTAPLTLAERLSTVGLRMRAWQYAAVLVLAFSGILAFHAAHRADATDTEIALLSGDLPPAAYLDAEFEQWIESSSRCASHC